MRCLVLCLGVAGLLSIGTTAVAVGQPLETIDFEGLPAGTILSKVEACRGTVSVKGFNQRLGRRPNAAVIFDTAEPTGEDEDLGSPNETCRGGGPGIGAAGQIGRRFENCPDEPIGNVLIIAEDRVDADDDGLVDDPDDEGVGGNGPQYTFDFSGVGGVTAVSLDLLDTEEPGPTVQFFDGENNLLNFLELPSTGNNGFAEGESLGPTAGVDRMVLVLNGSGSIDDLIVACEGIGDGCAPRFWKRNRRDWSATSYTIDQRVESAFEAVDAFPRLARKKLRRALSLGGGRGTAGGAKILLRAAVAALLNASHPSVGYPRGEARVIADVDAALASGDRAAMVDLAARLAADNDLGCPLETR